jgi:hypothetical protein
MTHVAKPMFICHLCCPLFNCAIGYFYSAPTTFADQVMVMTFSAESVNGFSAFSSQDIYDLLVEQMLQGSVNCGQANSLTLSVHQLMDLLSAGETARTFEGAHHFE